MSFLKNILDAMGEDGKDPEGLGAHMAEAFDEGIKASEDCRKAILNHAKPFMDKGQLIEAGLLIHVGVWSLVKWAQGGVEASAASSRAEGHGDGPVKRMWDLVRVAMTASSAEEAIAAMEKLRQEDFGDE